MPSSKQRKTSTKELVAHRLPDPTEISDGAFAKSRLTRTRIMEAAVECLAANGYASLSTTSVAERAGLTRAAMLYHFPSRSALIEAVVNYVTRKRVEMYGEAMARIAHDAQYFEQAIDIAWAQLQTPEFLAFAELTSAARTDPDLSVTVSPALAEFDRARRVMALELFPPEHVGRPWFDLRRDIARFLLEGLALHGGLSFDAERRKEEMIGFLKALSIKPESATVLEKAKTYATRGRRGSALAGRRPALARADFDDQSPRG
ncbi:MAG: TetR/AcrR family transcriptional regulator [Gammaproteobacteria bacterium]